MSSSIDSAGNTSTCVEDKEGDDSTEDVAAEQLALQIDHLSIENEGGDIPSAMASTNNADNIDNVTTCAACGKEGEEVSMNICNKCKTVHYCNVSCKKKHKSKHKKKCDRRVAELHDVDLFKEPSPREECPICMLPLPLDTGQSSFKSCCGKLICEGCNVSMMKEEVRRGRKKIEEHMCAFCRTPPSRSDEEEVEQIKRLMEKGNADAFYYFGGYHAIGSKGLRQDWVKAIELWLRAGELGCSGAYYQLGCSYKDGMGVEIDKMKAKYYWELAAISGDADARHNIGCVEGEAGNEHWAYKHILIAASAGFTKSLDRVKDGFMKGFVTKDEYAGTLRAYHERQTEMKSDAREAAADFLVLCAAKYGNT